MGDALNLTKWKASLKHPPSPNLRRRQHRRKVPRNQRRKPHLRRRKRRKLPKRRPKNRSLRKQQQRNLLLKSLLRRKSSVLNRLISRALFRAIDTLQLRKKHQKIKK